MKKDTLGVGFDRKGNCPICKKEFAGEECPHTYAYVMEVLAEVNRRCHEEFERDVQRFVRQRVRRRR